MTFVATFPTPHPNAIPASTSPNAIVVLPVEETDLNTAVGRSQDGKKKSMETETGVETAQFICYNGTIGQNEFVMDKWEKYDNSSTKIHTSRSSRIRGFKREGSPQGN